MHLKSDQINKFQENLVDWFRQSKRELPWRKTRHPYYVWISEVMLQQTQVKKVIPYYEQFIVKFPDIESLAAASLDEVLKSWELLGYYARARNLHKSARIIMNRYNGVFPDSYEAFRELPGVGDYIASAVMSICFNKPYPVIDGNVKRVLARLFEFEFDVSDSGNRILLVENAELLLDKISPGEFNQAMMELGALICRPTGPDCPACPVNEFCLACKNGLQKFFPIKKNKKSIPEYQIAVGIVEHEGQLLITRRKDEGLLGGLWEFPGGKVREKEAPYEACVREIKEEVNLNIKIREHLTRVRHAYSHFRIVADVYLCGCELGEIQLNGPVDYRWIDPSELKEYPFPAVNHKIFGILNKRWNEF
ncbi:MAG: A/G-specific adenine glycosylase [Calditrichaeota bacterium]|nr:A/G-specific adenine glycosylase [Calditrichota bacterium]RQW04235.1 MAG: A/G-specific adenine glycosylase [Calditrichota bacterium]